MDYTITTAFFQPENSKTEIAYSVATPNSTPRAVLQLIRGIGEDTASYDSLISALANTGVVVCTGDLPGYTMPDEKQADVTPRLTSQTLRLAVRGLYTQMRMKYRRLPYIMLGCGFGSAVLRSYIAEYAAERDANGSTLDGAAFCGISSAKPGKAAKFAAFTASLHGHGYKSEQLRKLAAAPLGLDAKSGGNLSKDDVKSILGTAEYRVAFELLKEIDAKEWADSIPKSLPIYIISGAGSNNGSQAVCDSLTDAEINNLSLRKYDKLPGELFSNGLNDNIGANSDEAASSANEVITDLISFIDDVCEGVTEMRSGGFGKV